MLIAFHTKKWQLLVTRIRGTKPNEFRHSVVLKRVKADTTEEQELTNYPGDWKGRGKALAYSVGFAAGVKFTLREKGVRADED